jgi:DNA-binding NtrC family response regulator
MDADLQSKLLRVVECGEYYRLGSDREERTTARIIAAVNTDVSDAIQNGRLREDLYYRLAEFIIPVPDLRERREDIGRLIRFFLRKICEPQGICAINEDCFAKLQSYDWPGNVRELQSVMNAASINCRQRGGNMLMLGDLDVFPSQLAREAAYDSFGSVDAIAGRVCEGETSLDEGMDALTHQLLQTVRDRLGGDAARIAKAMGKSESAVRMLYSRHGVSIGKTRDNHSKPRNYESGE